MSRTAISPRTRADRDRPVWGVVGGMGPLASAAFVATIYERFFGRAEQDMPTVLLISDPGYPDRTAAIAAGDVRPLAERLTAHIDRLVTQGAERVVICCMTIHGVLPLVPEETRARVLSLVDLLLMHAVASARRSLLLCTDGARQLRIYEQSSAWASAAPWLLLPSPRDQARVHALIYELKQAPPRRDHVALVDDLVASYGVNAIAAGCTELHLLARHAREDAAAHWTRCVDPLSSAADLIAARSMPTAGAASKAS